EQPVDPPVVEPPPVVLPGAPHAAFDHWAGSPYCLRADSLRDGLFGTPQPKLAPGARFDWEYDAEMDAARAIHRPTCRQQQRFLLETPVDSGSYTTVVAVRVPGDWKDDPSTCIDAEDGKLKTSAIVSKFLQTALTGGRHYLEKRMQRQAWGISGGVKVYDSGLVGPGREDAGGDCAPMVGPFHVCWDTWTWIVEHIDITGGPTIN